MLVRQELTGDLSKGHGSNHRRHRTQLMRKTTHSAISAPSVVLCSSPALASPRFDVRAVMASRYEPPQIEQEFREAESSPRQPHPQWLPCLRGASSDPLRLSVLKLHPIHSVLSAPSVVLPLLIQIE